MPTNQEWLHKLANESPDELKAWFDAEHVDETACVTKTPDLLDVEGVDSREKLEADVREWVDDIGWLSDKETQVADFIAWLDRQAAITNAAWKSLKESWVTAHDSLLAENAELRNQVDRLTAERDSLASDLNEMLMSIDALRDRFRAASSAALDNAHEIQRIIDQFWNV